MTADVTFIDSNVLVYAHDETAGTKRDTARSVLQGLWDIGAGALSTQVLQEFYVTMVKKVGAPLSHRAARAVVRNYLDWDVHRVNGANIMLASELSEHGKFSFWDALIVVSAAACGASTLLSEDMQDGFRFNNVVVRNPFAG